MRVRRLGYTFGYTSGSRYARFAGYRIGRTPSPTAAAIEWLRLDADSGPHEHREEAYRPGQEIWSRVTLKVDSASSSTPVPQPSTVTLSPTMCELLATIPVPLVKPTMLTSWIMAGAAWGGLVALGLLTCPVKRPQDGHGCAPRSST